MLLKPPRCRPFPVLALKGADSPRGLHRGHSPGHMSPQVLEAQGVVGRSRQVGPIRKAYDRSIRITMRRTGGHPTLSAALLHEPVVETSAPDPQPKADAAEPQTHYLFPELVSDDPLKARLRRRGRKHGIPSRRPRGSSSTSALNAAQIELWPDENNAVGDTYPG